MILSYGILHVRVALREQKIKDVKHHFMYGMPE